MQNDWIFFYKRTVLKIAKLIASAVFLASTVIVIFTIVDFLFVEIKWGYDWRSTLFGLVLMVLSSLIRHAVVSALMKLSGIDRGFKQ